MENLETLEEASKEFANSKKWMDKGAESWVEHTFIEGAKWRTKRMYSEEEVIDLLQEVDDLESRLEGKIAIRKWFEQFKKK